MIGDLTVRAHVEADDDGLVDARQVDIVLRDGTDTAVDDLDADFLGHIDLHERILEGLDRAGGIALDDDIEHIHFGLGELLLEAFERNHLAALGQLGRAFGGLTLLGDLACRTVVRGDQEQVACGRHGSQAEHLNRRGRGCGLHMIAVLVEHRTHAAVRGTGHDCVADVKRAGLHEHSRHGPCPVGLRRWRLERPYRG